MSANDNRTPATPQPCDHVHGPYAALFRLTGVHSHLSAAVDLLADQVIDLERIWSAIEDDEIDPSLADRLQEMITEEIELNTSSCALRDCVFDIITDLCDGLQIDNPGAFFVSVYECQRGRVPHASR